MAGYKHILVAVQLEDGCDDHLVQKAQEVSKLYGADISLVHTVEHLSSYGAAYGVSAGIDVEEILSQEANKKMSELAGKFALKADRCSVRVGPSKQVILESADEIHADLIIVGSHGRHGVRLLLGSTANAVLHGAKCDVLAVRVKD